MFDYIKNNFIALISISIFIIYGCYEHMNTSLNSLTNIFHKSKHHRNLKISNSGLLLHFIAINLLIINLVNNQIIDLSIYRLILDIIISLILIIKIILMIFYK